MKNIPLYGHTKLCSLTHLGCFHCLVIMKNNIKHICILQIFVYIQFSRTVTAGFCGNCMFNFLRYHQTVSESSGTTVCSQEQYLRVLTSLCPHQHLLLFTFMTVGLLVNVKCSLIVVLFVFP
jgi:hypothetical protein